MVEFTSRGGERATVAVLPFLSQRYAVRAAELVAQSPAENTSTYDQHVRSLVRALTAGFRTDAVNLVMAHLTVLGGTFGGGERAAQSIFEYSVPAAVFPPDAHYVALGHLHRRQALAAPVPVHYSGAPLAVDFGEQDNTSVVLLVEATPTTPARVTEIPITAGRRLRTVHGTVAELAGMRGDARRRPAARRGARARPGRAARGGHRAAAERAGGADRPGVRRIRHRLPAEQPGARTAARASCSASTWARGRSTTGGSRSCSRGCTTGSATALSERREGA